MLTRQVTPGLVSLLGVPLLLILVMAFPASAQLVDVEWNESYQLSSAPGPDDNMVGADNKVPEPISGTINGTDFSLTSSITFSSPGAPNITAMISGSYQSGDLIDLSGNAIGWINYQFAVRETSSPPVSVLTVPVDVRVQGTVEADGDPELKSQASAGANFFSLTGGTLDVWQISVDNSQGPASDSFNHNVQYLLAPDEAVQGGLTVSANINPQTMQNNTSSSSTGWADPVIEIADEAIPGGGGATYRDHYEIEFASGYWALGNPTPVEETTWGKIKRLYAN